MTRMSSKERVYATLAGAEVDRVAVTPIFMAWAAHFIGRTYKDYYLDGDVLARAQIETARAFHVDQVSAISDPWREASGYGMTFDYPDEGVGIPHDHLLKTPEDVRQLKKLVVGDIPRMQQRVDSVAVLAQEMGDTHSVLGWVEGPIAEYADLRNMQDAMMDLMMRPEMFTEAAPIIMANAIEFAVAQVRAGADMIGVGDAAASLIGPELYEQFVLPLEQELVAAIHDAGAKVKLHVCGNIAGIIHLMGRTGADIIDVDSMVPLADARAAVGPEITLCGNFDPSGVLLQGTPETVAQAAQDCIAAGGERFILMPGCEVPAGTPVDNLHVFCPAADA